MSFITELKRRNVFRVGIAYALAGWVLLQGADFVLDLVGAPNWVIQALSVAVVIGLPLALIFAWAFELTPEGVKRESEVDRSQSMTPKTGRKLDFIIIAILLVVIVVLVVRQLGMGPADPPAPVDIASEPVSDDNVGSSDHAARKSIAVLPFRDMSPGGDQAWFGEGIAEELLNALVKLEDLKVASRTSAFSLADDGLDIPAIAEQLDVEHILEGSIRTANNQVRVTAQLIDVTEDAHLWSETYDGTLDDIFRIQDEITAQIVDQLKVQLGSASLVSFEQQLTDNPEAYQLYLQGRQLWRQRNRDDLYASIRMLERAVELDPGFDEAWANLGLSWSVMAEYDSEISYAETVQRSLEAADEALRLNPDSSEGLLIRATEAEWNCRRVEAFEYYEQVIKVAPQDPTGWHWRAYFMQHVGWNEEGLASIEKAIQIDPLISAAHSVRSGLLSSLGRYDESDAAALRAGELGIYDNSLTYMYGNAFLRGDIEKAQELARQGYPGDSVKIRKEIELLAEALGDEQAWPAFYQEIGRAWSDNLMITQNRLHALTIAGRPYAFEFLADMDCPVLIQGIWAEGFRELRGTPEFLELMQRAGVVEFWEKFGWPDDCESVYGCPGSGGN